MYVYSFVVAFETGNGFFVELHSNYNTLSKCVQMSNGKEVCIVNC